MKTITLQPAGHGYYKITIEFRGKEYSTITSNMPLVDAYKNNQGRENQGGYTKRQASIALFNNVKQSNNL
jgi:hypothetical protein